MWYPCNIMVDIVFLKSDPTRFKENPVYWIYSLYIANSNYNKSCVCSFFAVLSWCAPLLSITPYLDSPLGMHWVYVIRLMYRSLGPPKVGLCVMFFLNWHWWLGYDCKLSQWRILFEIGWSRLKDCAIRTINCFS